MLKYKRIRSPLIVLDVVHGPLSKFNNSEVSWTFSPFKTFSVFNGVARMCQQIGFLMNLDLKSALEAFSL